jgi:dihydroorotase
MATARALTCLPRGSAPRLARRATSRASSTRSGRRLSAVAAAAPDELTITTPDDWHLHVRDAAKLASVVPFTARVFGRALIMPNLVPPVRTVEDATRYRDQILAAVPEGVSFDPQMTLYLTDNTSAKDIEDAAKAGFVRGCKLYPAGATTNSDLGVTDVSKITDVLRAMADCGLVLEVHGEVTHKEVDVFDRERVFLEQVLRGIVSGENAVKDLKIVMEHITTKEAVDFCLAQGPNVAATITPQHVLFNRNAMLVGGIRPHLYCLPILKREKHREAVASAAMSGSPKFFLGTDSAPHPRGAKESACGCAGVFSAHGALPFYASAFEKEGKLDKLEGFASHFGADFYGVPRNKGTVTLIKKPWVVPSTYEFGRDVVVPFFADETVAWRVEQPP